MDKHKSTRADLWSEEQPAWLESDETASQTPDFTSAVVRRRREGAAWMAAALITPLIAQAM